MKDALAEKKPTWQLYYDLVGSNDGEIMTQEYWLKRIDEQFEQCVGDADDRWNELRDSFNLP